MGLKVSLMFLYKDGLDLQITKVDYIIEKKKKKKDQTYSAPPTAINKL